MSESVCGRIVFLSYIDEFLLFKDDVERRDLRITSKNYFRFFYITQKNIFRSKYFHMKCTFAC